MAMTEKIKIMLIKAGMTQQDLAKKLGTSQPNLSKKFKLDDWRESDLEQIAKACGYTYEGYFRNNDEVI